MHSMNFRNTPGALPPRSGYNRLAPLCILQTGSSMIDLRHLRHALALAEHGNFARAAEACHITQSALTRSIQALEAALAVTLFDRGPGGVEPTEFGRLLLRHALNLDVASRELEREMQLAKGLEIGELTIGVGLYGGSALVAPVLARMSRLHPQLRLKVLVAPWNVLPVRARAREADVIVAELGSIQEQADFEHVALSEHKALLICRPGHPLALAESYSTQDLFQYPWMGPTLPAGVLERICSQAPAALRSPLHSDATLGLECDSAPLLKDVVMQSDGVAMMYRFMIERELAAGQLVALTKLELGVSARFGAGWIAGRTVSAAAGTFVELLRRHDNELAVSLDR
jgi:DNA-binding transcriptional LysR family regulator